MAIKIFPSANPTSSSCNDTASFSDIFTGMNFAVMKKAEFGITVINLSLVAPFDDSLDHGYCDSDEPGSAAAVDAATAAGIVVIVAAGNDALQQSARGAGLRLVGRFRRSGVPGEPGPRELAGRHGGILCTDQPVSPDGIVCFSDSASNLSLLAPGAFWKVVTKGGSTDTGFAGTSASTPAVAGAVVLLHQARPDLTPAGLVGVLRATGKPILDSRNGVVTPRIDTLAAVQLAASSFGISSAPAASIPDGTGSATATATISGFTRPIAAVQAWVEIDHPEPEQLRPRSPGLMARRRSCKTWTGCRSIRSTPSSQRGVHRPARERTWTWTVEDLVTGATGRIKFSR